MLLPRGSAGDQRGNTFSICGAQRNIAAFGFWTARRDCQEIPDSTRGAPRQTLSSPWPIIHFADRAPPGVTGCPAQRVGRCEGEEQGTAHDGEPRPPGAHRPAFSCIAGRTNEPDSLLFLDLCRLGKRLGLRVVSGRIHGRARVRLGSEHDLLPCDVHGVSHRVFPDRDEADAGRSWSGRGGSTIGQRSASSIDACDHPERRIRLAETKSSRERG